MLRFIIDILIIISSFISIYYIQEFNTFEGYNYLYYLPFAFLIGYFIFYRRLLKQEKNVFIYLFLIVTFFRYVVLPFLIVKTELYYGRSFIHPSTSSYQKATFLMVYEVIITFLLMSAIFSYRKVENIGLGKFRGMEMSPVYLASILLAFILFIMFPEVRMNFSFINVQSQPVELGLLMKIFMYFVEINKHLLYLLIIGYIYRSKFEVNIKIITAMIVTLIHISIFSGVNRADIVFVGVVSISLIFILFKISLKKIFIILPMIIVLLFSISGASEYRGGNTLTDGEDKVLDITNTLQIYLGGPYNVAISIEAREENKKEIKKIHFPLEVLRSTLGFNLILKNHDFNTTSDYFNNRIFYTEQKSQIVPSIGQGYIYFGYLLSPLALLLIIFVLKLLVNFRSQTTNYEMYYFLSLPIARMSLMQGQNAAILANDASFFLGVFIIIFYLNKKVKW